MPERAVRVIPDPVLKRRAEAVRCAEVAGLVADLLDTMAVSPGCVGLAAPQIGVPLRVFCLDVSGHRQVRSQQLAHHGRFALIDPVVVHREGEALGREGCMSVPDFTANVGRGLRVVVRGIDQHGDERVIDAVGFEARAVQHELDHLDGLLILDRVASLSADVFPRTVYQPRPPDGGA